jgi:gamma-tubulin complex component 2
VEHSLKQLTLQIAQLAVHYHSVTKFVESGCKFEHGQVNQALGAGLREIIKDYFILLSQTETLSMKV